MSDAAQGVGIDRPRERLPGRKIPPGREESRGNCKKMKRGRGATLIGNPAPAFDLPCTGFPDPGAAGGDIDRRAFEFCISALESRLHNPLVLAAPSTEGALLD